MIDVILAFLIGVCVFLFLLTVAVRIVLWLLEWAEAALVLLLVGGVAVFVGLKYAGLI